MLRLLLTILAMSALLESGAECVDVMALGRNVLDPEASGNAYGLVGPHTGWRFSPGDSAVWRMPSFNDGAWLELEAHDTFLDPETARRIGWEGVGWFRLHVDVDEEVAGHPLGAVVSQLGASEVYLDGKLVYRFGTVGTSATNEQVEIVTQGRPRVVPIRFDSPGRHLLAVRYSNYWGYSYKRLGFPAGFWVVFSGLQNALEQNAAVGRDVVAHQMLFIVPLAFALLHLLLFWFYRKGREHLDYAAFAGSMALLVFTPFQANVPENPWMVYVYLQLFKVALVLAGVTGLRFLHTVFLGTPGRVYRVARFLGILLLLGVWYLPLSVYFVFSVACYPEMLRTVVMGARRKRKGAMIIGVGAVAFAAACAYQVFLELGIAERADFDVSFPYIHGVLALVITMSVHLARSFAGANQDLGTQLERVHTLSERALEQERYAHDQERRAQEEEVARKVLESENEAREKELQEARRRQEALEALERTNKEVREAQAQLVQSEKMAALGNLVAGIAHEINTPVGAINSMHDTLVRAVQRLNSVLQEAVGSRLTEDRALSVSLQAIADANRVIATGCQRVTEIVRSLRSFARLDEAEMKRADLHECIDNTITLVHHEIKNRIRVEKRYGDIPEIVCFPSRLSQVFLNLLVNAAHAVEGEGSIHITTHVDGGNVVVAIEDDGSGIDPENLRRIFDPGFTTKGVGVGTGLGLSICYQIVKDHRGRIEVDSQAGRGTIFKVYLPLDLDQAAGDGT